MKETCLSSLFEMGERKGEALESRSMARKPNTTLLPVDEVEET